MTWRTMGWQGERVPYRCAHRDRVNANVMKDPRTASMCNPKHTPFDCKRMLYGGFKTIVHA